MYEMKWKDFQNIHILREKPNHRTTHIIYSKLCLKKNKSPHMLVNAQKKVWKNTNKNFNVERRVEHRNRIKGYSFFTLSL